MSGTLAIHRPGSRPLFIGGQAVYREPDPNLLPVLDGHNIKRTLRPGGRYEKGRCVEWTVQLDLRQRHVLDYTQPADRPSKHARGRIRPRTKAEQTRMANIRRRAVQARKSMTIDVNRFGVIFDEVAV